MNIDFIVASLPALVFGQPPPLTAEKFADICGQSVMARLDAYIESHWRDIEIQLRNAVADARGGDRYLRNARGCSVYLKNKVAACFQEKDVMKRQMLLDKTWWDAAEELSPSTSPLGIGALAAYRIRLDIALRHSLISPEEGVSSFDSIVADGVSGISVRTE